MGFAVLAFPIVIWLMLSVKVLNEYERGVVFRLGNLRPQPLGPGLVFVFFPLDRMVRGGLRTVVLDVPPFGQVLSCHATPRSDAEIFTRLTSADRLLPMFESVQAALVVCGHTHMQFDRTAERIRDTDYPQAHDFAARNVLQPPSESEMLELFSRTELKENDTSRPPGGALGRQGGA